MRFFKPGRRFIPIALIALSLSAIVPGGEYRARAGQADDKPADKLVMVLGDSISAEYGLPRGSGWVALLESRLAGMPGDWKVMNASISGETTAGGRTRIAGLLKRHRPALVILELGGNDALRGLDLKTTEANLNYIAELSRASGAGLVVAGMQVPPNYGRRYTEQFAAIFADVAAEHRGELVPFLLAAVAGRRDAFQADGIHPKAEVQDELLDTAWPAIERALAASQPDSSGSRR